MIDNRERQPHYLDDVTYDLAEDEAEGGNYWWFFAHLVLAAGLALGWRYFEPPPIVFSPPSPPMTVDVKLIHQGLGATYATSVATSLCYVGSR